MTDVSSGTPGRRPLRAAVIDLDAVARNVETLAARVAPAKIVAVVKANAYGHGAVPVARAALAGGAALLGVADLDEAYELRAGGIHGPVVAWLHDPFADFRRAIGLRIELGVSSLAQLERVAAATLTSEAARVHLKIDTGLNRNGVPETEWAAVVARAAELERLEQITVAGVFSHLANTSREADASQLAAFERALAVASDAGLRPGIRHIASSEAALRDPHARYDAVRVGIGMYGLTPFGDGTTSADLGLTPAMTLVTRVAGTHRAQAGAGVSYGHLWRAEHPTTLALVPLGYADGIPRHATGGGAEVLLGGKRRPIVGRIAMDQFVVDVGDDDIREGDEVVVFGAPATGAPTADELAEASGTIGYEIVTRIGPRVARVHVGGPKATPWPDAEGYGDVDEEEE
ncbi:alanine racemase [Agromyces protaetiae]|uniref:Alanine racemase n=1 Tax=Agromyces protaetiae TaxID=2509455 RepID=A0A4P6FBP9_9MICO|nr:alanine racemase [Agromyces protaetiae]QAY73195.1 alanine racemase [Agromyces protaetiae]